LKGGKPHKTGPTALVVGCQKYPAFLFCPLKTVHGDQEKNEINLPKKE